MDILEEYVSVLEKKDTITRNDISKLEIINRKRNNYLNTNLNKVFAYLEKDNKPHKIITNVVFYNFMNSYLTNNTEISIKTFDKYLSNFNFSDDYHRCNVNKIKGDIFEYITKYYFLSKNYETYLFNEIPMIIRDKLNIGTKDKGIDLIYKRDDIWIGVQCKWREKINMCIDKNLIAGFIEELKRTKLDYGLVFTNVNQITKYFRDSDLKWITQSSLENIITHKFITDIVHSQKEKIIKPIIPIKKLRKYQIVALNALSESTDRNKQCIMFCGTGKSIVMIEYIKKVNVDKVVVLMPSLQLISQFYKNLSVNCPGQNILCVCSQLDANSLTHREATDEQNKAVLDDFINSDTDKLFTTDPEIIKKKLSKKKIIVLCTYQSSFLLKRTNFDLGIFDEAHKTVNNDSFGILLSDKKCKINERIYFTATPRYYKGNDEKCISMNNELIYGKEVFVYPFKQAREEGYVLDFNIVAYVVPPAMADIVTERYIKSNKLNVDTNVIISAIQLAQHIKNTGTCGKILTYHNTVKNAIDYKKTLVYVFDLFKIDASIFVMSGKTTVRNRNKIFDEFEQSNIGVICSAKVLNEGIDIPCVDTIMFVDARSSTIDVTQCCGRGLRLYKEQKTCDIILPIHYNHIDGVHDYKHIVRILSAMNDIDSTLIEYFVINSTNNKITIREMEPVDYVVDAKKDNKIKYNFDDVCGGLDTAIISSRVLSFSYKLALLFEYCDENKCIPATECNYKNHNIGKWLGHQKEKIKCEEDDMYKKLKENKYIKINLDEYIKNKELNKDKIKLNWDEMCELVFEYCDKNKCIPAKECNYKNHNISMWLQNQKRTIKCEEDDIYKKLKENKYIKINLDEYIKNKDFNKNKIKLGWDKMRELVFEYCDKNKCIPAKKCNYKNHNIGMWLQNQKRMIKCEEDDMYQKLKENKYIKSNLDEYIKNKEKIKISWDDMCELLFEYCDKNKCIPSSKCNYKNQNIGMWLQTQKSKINCQQNDVYQKLKENKYIKINLDEYIKNKELNKDKIKLDWDEMCELVFEYCDKNKCIPSSKCNYKNQNIGMWLQTQKSKINCQQNDVYQKLKENKYIKINLDEYIKNKEPNKDKIKLGWDEMCELLFEYCDKNKCIPAQKYNYKNHNIGKWLLNQKRNIKCEEDDAYQKLKENKYIKINLDEYIKNKELNKDKIKLDWDEMCKLVFEYCDKNKCTPPARCNYKNKNIGMWLNTQKSKINSKDDDIYKKLKENEYIKINLDEYLEKKQNRT